MKRIRKGYLLLPLLFSFYLAGSCSNYSRGHIGASKDDVAATPETAVTPPSAGAAEQPAIATTQAVVAPQTVTKDFCNKQGKAFIAVGPDNDKNPLCGEPLVSWECTQASVMAKYPIYTSELQKRFDERKAMEFYNCGQLGPLCVQLHWMKTNASGTIDYLVSYIPEEPAAKCPP